MTPLDLTTILGATISAIFTGYLAILKYRDDQAAKQHASDAQPIIDQAPETIRSLLVGVTNVPLLQLFIQLATYAEQLASKMTDLEARVLKIPELERQLADRIAEITQLKQQRQLDQARIAELEQQVAELQRMLDQAKRSQERGHGE